MDRSPVFLIAVVLLGLPVYGAQAQPGEEKQVAFALQVRADEDEALITGLADSLSQAGFPAYVARPEGGSHYRLRMGPFLDRADAERFASFHHFEDYWIAQADPTRTFPRVVTQVIVDAVSLEPAPPYVYIGRRQPVVALRRPLVPRGIAPVQLHLYVPGRAEPLIVEDVTGLDETPEYLLIGQAERVFVNPQRVPITQFSGEIEAFSRDVGISSHVVRDGLAFYNDSTMARFTLLRAYDFVRDTLVAYAQPGFDFVNDQGERVRFTGYVRRRQAVRQGHARAWRLMPGGAGTLDVGQTALYVRPGTRGDVMELCIAFFKTAGQEEGMK